MNRADDTSPLTAAEEWGGVIAGTEEELIDGAVRLYDDRERWESAVVGMACSLSVSASESAEGQRILTNQLSDEKNAPRLLSMMESLTSAVLFFRCVEVLTRRKHCHVRRRLGH